MTKHYKGSWRTMKSNMKERNKPSKLCSKCANECVHWSIGELTYCYQFVSKYDKKEA